MLKVDGQGLLVGDFNGADAVAVAVLDRAANARGVFAVDEGILDAASHSGDLHEEAVLESGVVGVELNLDVHCANSIQHSSLTVNRYFAKNAGKFCGQHLHKHLRILRLCLRKRNNTKQMLGVGDLRVCCV